MRHKKVGERKRLWNNEEREKKRDRKREQESQRWVERTDFENERDGGTKKSK